MDNDVNLLQQKNNQLEQELVQLRQQNQKLSKEADELWLNIQTRQFEFEVLERAIKNFIQRSQIDITNLKTQLKRTHTTHKKTATNFRQSTKQTEIDAFSELADNFRTLQRDNQLLIDIISSLGQSNKLPQNIPIINNDVVRDSLETIEKKLDGYEKLRTDFEMLAFLLWRTTSHSTKTKMNTKEDEFHEFKEHNESNFKLEGDSKSSRHESEEKVD